MQIKRRNRIDSLFFAVLLCIGSVSAVRADAVPSDPASFTDYVARAFAQALPGAKVAMTRPLSLTIDVPGTGKHEGYLENLYDQCRGAPERCAGLVASWVDQISTTDAQKDKPLDRASLRIVVRPKTAVDQLRQAQKQEPVAAPFIAGLWMICVADLPKAIEFPNAKEFEALGLSRADALKLCKENTAKALAPIKKESVSNFIGKIGLVANDPYESSRLLLPESWAPLVGKSQTPFFVTAPGSDVLLYTRTKSAAAIKRLQVATIGVAAKARRPLSLSIFRWTPSGFQEVAAERTDERHAP
ncbi:MAG TPA: hypothetical protein VGL83_19605 [Stellaceae bacterium]